MYIVDKPTLRGRIHGMLAGVAIGDALGMPVETMYAKDIAFLNEGKGVTGYMDPVQTRIDDTKNMKRGDTTDDWQLTKAVATSLVEFGGFGLNHQAETHIKEMNKSTFGWGKGTTLALKQIEEGKRTAYDKPLFLGEKKGSGNGVIMKISPLAAFSAISGKGMYREVLDLGRMTHTDARAIFAGLVAYLVLWNTLNGYIYQRKNIRSTCENVFSRSSLKDSSRSELEELISCIENVNTETTETLIATAGVGFVAWETIAFTLGVYERNQTDFSKAILEAVNAGGDTDTNASIVGALVGATVGINGIDKRWLEIPVMEEVLQVADDLCNAFS